METPGYRLELEEREGFLHAVITGDKDSYDVTMGAIRELARISQTRGG